MMPTWTMPPPLRFSFALLDYRLLGISTRSSGTQSGKRQESKESCVRKLHFGWVGGEIDLYANVRRKTGRLLYDKVEVEMMRWLRL